MGMEVTLKLTEKQATVVVAALDVYSRILIGQTENVEHVLTWAYMEKISLRKIEEARALLNRVKHVIWGFHPGESFSILNDEVHDEARQAYDLMQVVRNGVARFKKPEGGVSVVYDQPHQTSKEEALATLDIKP